MATIFELLVSRCGLSQREAAEYLGVRIDTVKSWASGRRQPQDAVLGDLARLAEKIARAAEEAIAQIDAMAASHGPPDAIDLGLASDDTEARDLGWPCVGAQAACLAAVVAAGIARGYTFRVGPRGATPPTAAAADAHDRLR